MVLHGSEITAHKVFKRTPIFKNKLIRQHKTKEMFTASTFSFKRSIDNTLTNDEMEQIRRIRSQLPERLVLESSLFKSLILRAWQSKAFKYSNFVASFHWCRWVSNESGVLALV